MLNCCVAAMIAAFAAESSLPAEERNIKNEGRKKDEDKWWMNDNYHKIFTQEKRRFDSRN
jgi:hypothetical protein